MRPPAAQLDLRSGHLPPGRSRLRTILCQIVMTWPRRKKEGLSLVVLDQIEWQCPGTELSEEGMMRRWVAAGLLLAMAPLMAAAPQAEKTEAAKVSLKVGDPAPDFTLLSDSWKTVKLSDFRGKRNVFLAVYVLAFTGG